MKRIAKHTFRIHNTMAMVSTVQIYGEYETMVMYEDGEELESYINQTYEEATACHNRLVNKYNDRLYESSLKKYFGVPNLGQFVEKQYYYGKPRG